MGIGSPASASISQRMPSPSGKGGITLHQTSQSQYASPLSGLDAIYGYQQPSAQQTNSYAAPFQQRYVQQFYPEAKSFVPQSAENYRSPFAGGTAENYRLPFAGGMGGKGGFPMASGGVIKAATGRYLQGPGDGTSDSIPATIGNAQPARLADGEFVIDARTVSEIGNGSSNAGAKKLYAMMERVHRERKKAKRGQDSNADRFLPR